MYCFWSLLFALSVVSSSPLLGFSSSTTWEILQSRIKTEHKLDLSYFSDQTEYWSSDCSRLRPDCILVPRNATEVVQIVSTLVTTSENFAVKAGGHNLNRFFSGIDDGPLISLKALNHVFYDPVTNTAKIGPGNRWIDVVRALQPYGVAVVGGRIGHVGVGGYLLGGGLSNLSTQHGWAANNVVEFEVVLASATIVIAFSTNNIDLFKVLKGGGNNFGVVTSYTLKTFPIGTIWGGNLEFSSDKTEALLGAVRTFTENYPNDKAAVIVINMVTLSTAANIWILFLFYDGPTAPPGTFDLFLNLGPNVNTCKSQDFLSFVSADDDLVITGQVFTILYEMSPLPNATVGRQVMRSYYDSFYSVVRKNALIPGLTATIAFQPLPKRFAKYAKNNGGDLLDLDDSVDRMLMKFNLSYDLSIANAQVDAAIVEIFEGVRERVQAFMASGVLPDAYLPVFMNDANYQQDYWGRLRPETLNYARGVRDRVDAQGLFRTKTGGFKMP